MAAVATASRYTHEVLRTEAAANEEARASKCRELPVTYSARDHAGITAPGSNFQTQFAAGAS